MPTGYVNLFPGGTAPDGTGTGNNTAALSYLVSAATQGTNTPKVTQLRLLFDAATDEHWTFQVTPRGAVSADDGKTITSAIIRLKYEMTSATTGNVIAKASQMSVIESSTLRTNFAYVTATLSATDAVPGTLGQSKALPITLTTTNMVLGRNCLIFVGRDADNASDTAAGDMEVTDVQLEYSWT